MAAISAGTIPAAAPKRPACATPIIAVTSYAMVGDREKCLEAGCTGYIEKPIDPEVFVDQIESIRAAVEGAEGAP